METNTCARASTRPRPASKSRRHGKTPPRTGTRGHAKTAIGSGIPFSAMRSGGWKIIVSGNQIGVQRSITLTVGVPATTTVTVGQPRAPMRLENLADILGARPHPPSSSASPAHREQEACTPPGRRGRAARLTGNSHHRHGTADADAHPRAGDSHSKLRRRSADSDGVRRRRRRRRR